MAFKVTLNGCSSETSFYCDASTYILDAAEGAGIDLPYSCRAGACTSCVCKIESGICDSSDQAILDDDQIANGYVPICVAYPRSDVTLKIHAEGDIAG